ncbi:MAG TPA: chorismate-binding protein [Gemmatimonadales bacterium]|nr:chorismate-binding protein [Gemmatimonadales bacterium]
MTARFPDAAVLAFAPNRVVLGVGPFTRAGHRLPDRPAFYAPDFFLDDPAPWHHPAEWRELSLDELRRQVGPERTMPALEWQAPDRAAYETTFAEIGRRLGDGTLLKAVPVVATGACLETDDPDLGPALLARASAMPAGSALYGLWTDGTGVVGATPEHLFRRNADGTISTIAVAGTYPPGESDALRADPKELAEHRSVVEDITSQLAPLGAVSTGPLDVLELPHMTHLKTDITLTPAGVVTFEELVRTLHPTAALGLAPRDADGALRRQLLDVTGGRGRFGAPFGFEWPDGRAICLVAIRNVQWHDRQLSIVVGGGVITESRLDREWQELELKQRAVRRMLGL